MQLETRSCESLNDVKKKLECYLFKKNWSLYILVVLTESVFIHKLVLLFLIRFNLM